MKPALPQSLLANARGIDVPAASDESPPRPGCSHIARPNAAESQVGLAAFGGRYYFDPVTVELSDWMPTHEHFPLSKREGGRRTADNAILAHHLCNRIDYSLGVGRGHARDLERVTKAREEAIRRNNETP